MGNCCASEEGKQFENDVTPRKGTNGSLKNKKKQQKGATLSDDFAAEFTEKKSKTKGKNKMNKDLLWDDPMTLKDDTTTDSTSLNDDTFSLTRKGKTLPLFKPRVIEKVLEDMGAKVKEARQSIEAFEYRKKELDVFKESEKDLEVRDVDKDSEGENYFGQWNTTSDTREGRGICVYDDNSLYVGFWKNSKKNGAGRLILKNGDIYQGLFKDDKYSGYGVFISESGYNAKGYWKNGVLDGQGYESTKKSTTYRGNFVKGVKTGKGHFKFEDGSNYEGDVVDGKMDGKGKYYFPNGQWYEGQFQQNKMHGFGVFNYEDGSKYEGQYLNDQCNGKGKYIYKSGEYFDGEWKDNVQHGEGIFVNNKGKEFPVKYEKGVLIKK